MGKTADESTVAVTVYMPKTLHYWLQDEATRVAREKGSGRANQSEIVRIALEEYREKREGNGE